MQFCCLQAIPMDIVRSSVEQIIKYGKVVRPVLGISFMPDAQFEEVSVQSTALSVVLLGLQLARSCVSMIDYLLDELAQSNQTPVAACVFKHFTAEVQVSG